MRHYFLLTSASVAALTLSHAAFAQQSLPTIDVGRARVDRNASSDQGDGSGHAPEQGAGQTSSSSEASAQEREKTSYRRETATTATKMNTPIMDTPVSIQVVPQQVILDQQATTLARAVDNVSGVRSFDASYVGGNDRFQIRGFDTNFVYVDGLRIQNALPGTSSLINVDRVEVLKGPAAILYGRADPGGIVNIVTKKPLAYRQTSVSQAFGSYGFYRTTLDTTGPMTKDETILYRVTAEADLDHTFRETDYYRNYFISPVVQWNISNATQITVNLQYSHQAIPFDAGQIAYTRYNPLSAFFGEGPVAFLPRGRTFNEANSSSRVDYLKFGYNWSHNINNDWTLTNRFEGLQYEDHSFLVVPTGFNAQNPTLLNRSAIANNDARHSVTTNLDLTGKFDMLGVGHTVLIGGDYLLDRSFNSFFGFSRFPQSAVNYNFPVYTFAPTYNWLYKNSNAGLTALARQQWLGFYVQDQMRLPYNFFLLAGARYDRAVSNSNPFDGKGERLANNSQRVTPRVGLLWRPIEVFSVYGSYTENFGAAGGRAGPAAQQQILPSQTATQWEVGAKTELFDKRLTGTLALYDLRKTNIAVPDPDPVRASQGYRIINGEVRNRGIELDVSGEILPGWRIIGGYSYIYSVVTKDSGVIRDPLGTTVSVNGFQGFTPPDVSRHMGSVFTTYEMQDGDLKGLKFGGGVNGRTKAYGDSLNSFHVPSYAIFNLMASYAWNFSGYKLTGQMNVDNLADTRYYPSGFRGPLQVSVGAPRTIKAQLRVDF